MNQLLLGMIAMASFVAGLFFMRFWRSTNDRFFLFLAIAFFIEMTSRISLALVTLPEDTLVFYLMRLCAFGLIIFAIIDKNWPKRKT